MEDFFLESQRSGWVAQCNRWQLWLKVTIERKLWGDVMHMEELSFPLIHAFQANIWIKGNCRDPPFTRNHSPIDQTTSPLLSTRDPTGLDHELQRKYIFCWILNDFFTGNLNIHLGFPICQPRPSSQGFKRTHQDPRALMFILLHII